MPTKDELLYIKAARAIWILAFIVIVLGAYTRLTDAGLGCPDWPGCYGKVLAPTTEKEVADVASIYPGLEIEPEKAWTEMIHRYVAGTLGLLVFALSALLIRAKKYAFAVTLSALIIFQALLGMWTVTLGLYPVVVMGHLLGGLTLLSMLTWLATDIRNKYEAPKGLSFNYLPQLALVALCVQIMLGGWTSSNYAALVCADFPTCQGQWWPKMDWLTAFNFSQAGIFDSPGIALENPARVAIQVAHRIGALLTTIILSLLSWKMLSMRQNIFSNLALVLLALLAIQVTLGITNIFAGLPLFVAVAHNAVAAILLCSILIVNKYAKHVIICNNK